MCGCVVSDEGTKNERLLMRIYNKRDDPNNILLIGTHQSGKKTLFERFYKIYKDNLFDSTDRARTDEKFDYMIQESKKVTIGHVVFVMAKIIECAKNRHRQFPDKYTFVCHFLQKPSYFCIRIF